MRFPFKTIYNSVLFISKLSSVTVGFLVRNGFGVSWKACHRNLKPFWSLDQGLVDYLKRQEVVQQPHEVWVQLLRFGSQSSAIGSSRAVVKASVCQPVLCSLGLIFFFFSWCSCQWERRVLSGGGTRSTLHPYCRRRPGRVSQLSSSFSHNI